MIPFSRLLVVVGLSGSGKSTLIRNLVDGLLPPAVAGRLPAGAEAWRIVPISEYPKWEGFKASDGLIVHADKTMCFIRPGIFEAVLPVLRVPSATIVDVGADPNVIAARLVNRIWQARDLALADPSFTREAFFEGFQTPRGSSATDEAALVALAARAGIPALAAYKLAITRRPNWAAPILALWDRQAALHWSKWTVDQVSLRSSGDAVSSGASAWRLAGFGRRTY